METPAGCSRISLGLLSAGEHRDLMHRSAKAVKSFGSARARETTLLHKNRTGPAAMCPAPTDAARF